MFKNKITYLIVTGLLFVILVSLQHFAPGPVDWKINFRGNKKSPYGCYVIRDMLSQGFSGNEVLNNEISLYESWHTGKLQHSSLIIITDHFAPDKHDLNILLDHVHKGSTAFISAFDFGDAIADTLGIDIHSPFFDTSAFRKGREMLNFLNPALKKDPGYIFSRKMPSGWFTAVDTMQVRQLGIDRSGKVNYIALSFGEGQFLLHCQPMAFTNYHILYGDAYYAGAALAYVPHGNIVWDDYYKPDKLVNASPVRYILSQPALRSAYYLTLIFIVFYMIIESKRRQRGIPVIKPWPNTSLRFIETIGRLYHKSSNHTDLARKKTTYFKEFLRARYYLNTIDTTEDKLQLIASKSGVPLQKVRETMLLVESIRQQKQISSGQLINLHKRIEEFYSSCI